MGALDGIKVLELTSNAVGELTAMILADMGADVVRIDKVEAVRDADRRTESWMRRTVTRLTNRNKRSIALNLKRPEAGEILARLAAGADVVVEGFRPGVMARLGADYESVRASNPRVVYCSLSGFGQDGPYRDRSGHDLNYLALSGALDLIGSPGEMPAIPLNLVADFGGAALHGALGIVLALFARERTGAGQYVDVAYLDATIGLLAGTPNLRGLLAGGAVAGRGEGLFCGRYPFYAVYETRDGKLLTVASIEARLWANFCTAIGRPDLVRFAYKPEHGARGPNADEEAARLEIAAVIKTRDRDRWERDLAAADACVAGVHTPAEMTADPQVLHRKMVLEVDHPAIGVFRQFGIPIKLSATPGEVRAGAPLPGEHTDEILRELRCSAARIAELRGAGAVR